MAKKIEPLQKRWASLATTLKDSKNDLDFGKVDVNLSASEQEPLNELAMSVKEMVKEMREIANQLDKEFDHYVNSKRDDAIQAAMSDSELRELVLSMALEKGLLNTLDLSSEVESGNEEPTKNNSDQPQIV
ncbi:hypothetical protein ACFXEB_08615 [Aerococcus urinaeequi]|uniref:hypothetical protein n=1 Tax=Aerococcus urinaeequi TaxID=51665 RepID=UPI0036726AA9